MKSIPECWATQSQIQEDWMKVETRPRERSMGEIKRKRNWEVERTYLDIKTHSNLANCTTSKQDLEGEEKISLARNNKRKDLQSPGETSHGKEVVYSPRMEGSPVPGISRKGTNVIPSDDGSMDW